MKAAAERIREDIASRMVRTFRGPISVTVSVGCAVGIAAADSAEDLLRLADEALYEATRRGRNCVATMLLQQVLSAELS